MTSPRSLLESNADFFLKFGGALALLWAFLRWLFLPMVKAGLRELLREELAAMRKLSDGMVKSDSRYGVMSRDLYDAECDIEEIWEELRKTRELTEDLVVAFDAVIGFERRKKGDPSDMRHLPELPVRKSRKPHRFLHDEELARREQAAEDKGE